MAKETMDAVELSLVCAHDRPDRLFAGEPSLPYPADPETRKAIGANELTAAELKKKLDAGEPVLVIEVRDASFYEKERILGAIHMPFADLQEPLQEIPKDRPLVFT
jgi:hypothetical protein